MFDWIVSLVADQAIGILIGFIGGLLLAVLISLISGGVTFEQGESNDGSC